VPVEGTYSFNLLELTVLKRTRVAKVRAKGGEVPHALVYECPALGLCWYIPTSSEAHKWRGAYTTWGRMRLAVVKEMGANVRLTETTVKPSFLVASRGRLDALVSRPTFEEAQESLAK
jgi:hypothetical protein